jgi:hypothetical protein
MLRLFSSARGLFGLTSRWRRCLELLANQRITGFVAIVPLLQYGLLIAGWISIPGIFALIGR